MSICVVLKYSLLLPNKMVNRLSVSVSVSVCLCAMSQNCDLLGSDLQHANLRGANIEGAILTDIVV